MNRDNTAHGRATHLWVLVSWGMLLVGMILYSMRDNVWHGTVWRATPCHDIKKPCSMVARVTDGLVKNTTNSNKKSQCPKSVSQYPFLLMPKSVHYCIKGVIQG